MVLSWYCTQKYTVDIVYGLLTTSAFRLIGSTTLDNASARRYVNPSTQVLDTRNGSLSDTASHPQHSRMHTSTRETQPAARCLRSRRAPASGCLEISLNGARHGDAAAGTASRCALIRRARKSMHGEIASHIGMDLWFDSYM
jgi:hypothetical protein